MIRATATDGDALSVREGLYLGCPVIATDRVDRPEGVILYHYNDRESLTRALSEISLKQEKLQDSQGIDKIIYIYRQQMEK